MYECTHIQGKNKRESLYLVDSFLDLKSLSFSSLFSFLLSEYVGIGGVKRESELECNEQQSLED